MCVGTCARADLAPCVRALPNHMYRCLPNIWCACRCLCTCVDITCGLQSPCRPCYNAPSNRHGKAHTPLIRSQARNHLLTHTTQHSTHTNPLLPALLALHFWALRNCQELILQALGRRYAKARARVYVSQCACLCMHSTCVCACLCVPRQLTLQPSGTSRHCVIAPMVFKMAVCSPCTAHIGHDKPDMSHTFKRHSPRITRSLRGLPVYRMLCMGKRASCAPMFHALTSSRT